MEFRWVGWNAEHIGEHGITPADAEHLVEHNGFRNIGNEKLTAAGQTAGTFR